jgi:hypothetical protein
MIPKTTSVTGRYKKPLFLKDSEIKGWHQEKAIRCCDTPSKTPLLVYLLGCRWFSG